MHPEISINLFGSILEIKSYALFTALGALVGVLSALPLFKKEGLRTSQSIILLTFMAITFFIGARILNFVVNPGAYGESLHIYSIQLSGFSVYGGIIGALSTLLIVAKKLKLNSWALLDTLVLPFVLSFVLARIGCYLNGCCVGIPTETFWGVPFPVHNEGQEIITGILALLGKKNSVIYRYPTQLFEITLALLGLIPVLFMYFGKRLPKGAAFLLYVVWFSTMRLMILPLRSLPYPYIVVKLIYPLVYISFIIIGIYLLNVIYKKSKNS